MPINSHDPQLDADLSKALPSSEEADFAKAEQVKEALQVLGGSNQELAEFCNDYFFASEEKIPGDERVLRSQLQYYLAAKGIDFEGCALRFPRHGDMFEIEYKGEKYTYNFYNAKDQGLWVGGYPEGNSVGLRQGKPARVSGFNKVTLNIVTQKEIDSHTTYVENAKKVNKEREQSRSGIFQKAFDRMTGYVVASPLPARPVGSVEIYEPVQEMALRAAEALEATKKAFEHVISSVYPKQLPEKVLTLLTANKHQPRIDAATENQLR